MLSGLEMPKGPFRTKKLYGEQIRYGEKKNLQQ